MREKNEEREKRLVSANVALVMNAMHLILIPLASVHKKREASR